MFQKNKEVDIMGIYSEKKYNKHCIQINYPIKYPRGIITSYLSRAFGISQAIINYYSQ